MFTRRTSVLFPLIAASLPLAVAAAAGLPQGLTDDPGVQVSPQQALEKARQLMAQNQPVAARALLLKALENQSPSKEIHEESLQVLAEASRRIRTSDPLDVSLQKARVAMDEGDYRLAEQHTQAVNASATVTPDQAKAAVKLTKDIQSRRSELAATIPSTLEQAKRDFDGGRYAEAKAGFQMVDRSGVKLSREQRSTLETYQMKLVNLGDGALFGSTASAGLMQPGTVRRRDDQPTTQPTGQPAATQPTNQPAGNDLIAQAKRAEAARAISQADASFRDAKYPEAINRYEAVRAQYRDVLTAEQAAHISAQVDQAQARRGGTPSGAQPGLQDRVQRHNEAVATFNNDLDQARRAREGGDFTRARDLIARARLAINSNRDVFSETELENKNQEATNALADISKAEQAAFQRATEQKSADAAKAAVEADKQARQERDRKIVEFIDRARAYQSEKRYEEALQAIEQLLFLDPINPTGLLLRDAYFDIIMYDKSYRIYNSKLESFGQLSLDNSTAAIPPVNVVNYPLDWPAISARRGEPVQFAESPENRAVLSALGSKRIPSVAFNDNALRDVVEYIKTVTNLNVDADWASLEGASIQPDTTVSLNLTNVSAKTLLDRITEKVSGTDKSQKADWAVIDGVVTIASDEKIRKRVELVIYDVKDLLIEVPDYRDVPQIDLQQALQASQGGGGGGQSPFRDQQQQEDDEERERAREENLDEMIQIIRDNIDTEGWVENGGDTGKITKVGNAGNLIITNTPKNHRQIAGLLGKLREIRAMQINVETRFLLVNQDWFEQIGFDLDLYIDGGSNQVQVARGADRSILPSDFFNFGAGGFQRVVTGQVGPNAATTTPQGTQLTQAFVPPNNFSPVGFGQNSLGLSQALAPQSDWSDAILGAAPALGIAGQFLDDIQVDFLIQATQADRRSIQLTAPRITFTNGQASNIYVATQVAFVSELDPVVGDSAVGFDPTVAVVTEGVTLLVEGTVSADRRYVTMNVDAGVARIDGFAQQAVSAVAGGQLVSSADTQSFIQLPQVTVTRVRTTVTVPDQGTLLMGGQRLTTEYEIETGVPVLSKIPIINRFFTNRIESREEQTLLILVKPTVLIQNENEEVQFPGLLDTVRQGIGG
jgi:type II secretory pathway component GspD/PulD (secretin)/tetratricopeptide (TPR) repeat protein